MDFDGKTRGLFGGSGKVGKWFEVGPWGLPLSWAPDRSSSSGKCSIGSGSSSLKGDSALATTPGCLEVDVMCCLSLGPPQQAAPSPKV